MTIPNYLYKNNTINIKKMKQNIKNTIQHIKLFASKKVSLEKLFHLNIVLS